MLAFSASYWLGLMFWCGLIVLANTVGLRLRRWANWERQNPEAARSYWAPLNRLERWVEKLLDEPPQRYGDMWRKRDKR